MQVSVLGRLCEFYPSISTIIHMFSEIKKLGILIQKGTILASV